MDGWEGRTGRAEEAEGHEWTGDDSGEMTRTSYGRQKESSVFVRHWSCILAARALPETTGLQTGNGFVPPIYPGLNQRVSQAITRH